MSVASILAAAVESADAVVTAIAVGFPAAATVIAAHIQQSKKIDAVQKSVATSNGKSTGQLVEELSAGQRLMQVQLAEHTVQDASNFATLEARLGQVTKDEGAVALLQIRVAELEKEIAK